MRTKIDSISIKAFRGIPDLDLEINGKSLVLIGENGTGKSSIVEAIEFFFLGRVSHLEGIQGINNIKHIPHVKYSAKDVKVAFKFLPNNVILERTFRPLTKIPQELKDYFDFTKKNTFILHRAQVLEFIIAQPSERFRSIGNIIGIGELDHIESEIKKLNDELYNIITPININIKEKTLQIESIIGRKLISEKEIIDYINAILAKNNFQTIDSLEDLDNHLEKLFIDIKKNINENKITIINKIIDFTSQFPLREICLKLNQANRELIEVSNEEHKTNILLLNFLNESKNLLKNNNFNRCPLCEQEIQNIDLLKIVEGRIELYKTLSSKVSNIKSILANILSELNDYCGKINQLIEDIQKIDELANFKDKLMEHKSILNDLLSIVRNAESTLFKIQELNTFQNMVKQFEETIKDVNEVTNKIYSNIQLSEDERRIIEIRDNLMSLKNLYNDLLINKAEKENPENKYKLVNKLYSTFIETKKKVIQEIYDNILNDIETFYSILHPNELHKNIKLIVKEKTKGGTELKIESFGRQNEDPRALTSEGHLDSLGLCIFLSFVKKFNENFPLIVLDDVVTTIDSGHRNKICKLINENFVDKQLIITTHDAIWFDQLVDFQRAYGCQNDFYNLRIRQWSLENGPIIESYKPKWEKIAQKLNQGEIFGVGNECRNYLEWVLKNLCQNFDVSVIYRESGRYNLSELLDPAEKKLKDIMPEEENKETLKKIFIDIRSSGSVGNLLSHSNEKASNIHIKDIDYFFQSIFNLHNFYLCPNCKTFLKYDKEFKKIICPNRKCKDRYELQC